MQRKTGIAVFAVILLVAVGAAVFLLRERKQGPAPLVPIPQKIRIGVQANAFSAMVLVAQGQGFFANQGLTVELVPYPSGKLALDGMLAGEVDMATTSEVPIVSKSFERTDFSVLCTLSYTDNGAWILARKDHGINQPTDLRGKRIATQKGSAPDFFIDLFLLHHLISKDEVKIVYLPAKELPQALISGEIDAFAIRNPFIAEAKSVLGDQAVEFFAPEIYRQTFNLVATKEFIQKAPEVQVPIMKALVVTEEYIAKNKEGAIATTIKELGEKNGAEVRSDWPSFVFSLSFNQALINLMEEVAKWSIRNGAVASRTIPNYLNMMGPKALRAVKPDAVDLFWDGENSSQGGK